MTSLSSPILLQPPHLHNHSTNFLTFPLFSTFFNKVFNQAPHYNTLLLFNKAARGAHDSQSIIKLFI